MKYNIKFLENEFWYGGIVDLAGDMPYSEKSNCKVDLTNTGSDLRMPLYISTQGRYIWSEKPFVIEFNNGEIAIDGADVEICDGFIDLKGAHRAVANRHFSKNKNIPNELFFKVPQYNTWIEFMYNQNQTQILEYAHAIVDNNMMPGILMIDEGWSEDYGVFDFYPGRFENPKFMVDELHKLGFKVMLWITPYISPDSHAFRELKNTDYLLKDKNNEFAIREWWNGYSCALDLSNPNASKWFKNKLDELMNKYGIDGFKFDAGDPAFYRDDDITYKRNIALDNTKEYDMFAAQYEFNELRAVWNMGGEPIVSRLQDKRPEWENYGINCIIPFTIVQGLLGGYYGCPDMIGGGEFGSFLDENYKLDEELYIRWLEASVLCPMMQFSIAPWRILSKEAYETVLKIVKLREEFSEYIIELAKNAAVNNEPIVRALEYEFPHCGCEQTKDMFMLGNKYLVVPMVKKGETTKSIRLPKGKWHLLDGRLYDGETDVCLEYSIDKIYVFEKLK
ncbi:glycoside hydrolase family 31 protein [Ructibacterium gallinarum]|uniref:Alpha-galactosidase n=1 Tax=Ructibacterium gallinarum TaxID=2779355 RepID=A0A9D5LZE8_9FIRM|nr:glycoside hydrolase family 31 protein [Ructibacterium gallinarum]MBE5040876.1 alpha-galactosidase [Ructibacterium gallinarum]